MFNKKASNFDDWGPTIVTVIFIVIIVFLFAGYQINKEKNKFCEINQVKMVIESEELLLNYLQTNTSFDINGDSIKDDITIKDLIVYSYLNDDNKGYKELKKITEEILQNTKRNAVSGWGILIFLMPEKKELVSLETYSVALGGGNIASESSAIIPLTEPDKYILVGLYERWQGIIC